MATVKNTEVLNTESANTDLPFDPDNQITTETITELNTTETVEAEETVVEETTSVQCEINTTTDTTDTTVATDTTVTTPKRKVKPIYEKVLKAVDTQEDGVVSNRICVYKEFNIALSDIQVLYTKASSFKIGTVCKVGPKKLSATVKGQKSERKAHLTNLNWVYIPNSQGKLLYVSQDVLRKISTDCETLEIKGEERDNAGFVITASSVDTPVIETQVTENTEASVEPTTIVQTQVTKTPIPGQIDKSVVGASSTYLLTDRNGFKYGIVDKVTPSNVHLVSYGFKSNFNLDNKNFTLVEFEGNNYLINLDMFI